MLLFARDDSFEKFDNSDTEAILNRIREELNGGDVKEISIIKRRAGDTSLEDGTVVGETFIPED